ncbi:unnamed protein product [Schistosoma curassoni]|uniref:ORF3 n=1 Tax=Schistosoma curassoni TaxID=6186 RepID=A0A183JE25_9TREM|nr:unnamed protein product [Schistosoma curassoni]
MSLYQRSKKSGKSRVGKQNWTRQRTSRSSKVKHRGTCKDTPSPIQEDLRGRTGADRLERRTRHLVLDWIMKTSTSKGEHRKLWTTWMRPDYLGFADDQALLSYAHQPMQVKISSLTEASETMGLNIHKEKERSSNATRRTPTQSHLMQEP